jgi:DNA-binding CsgD family transcriptional regulator
MHDHHRASAAGTPLLEREQELQSLERSLAAAAAGRGGLALLEGRAGTGKSRLLAEAARRARERGMEVLEARGDEHERDFPFGIALQLLEKRLRRLHESKREAVLRGAAGLAERLLMGRPPPGAVEDTEDLFSVIHGLYWVTHNLADIEPTALVVDDAQWADEPSLRFLAYLTHRASDLPVTVLIGRRTGEREAHAGPLQTLAAQRGATRVRLAPLGAASVAELVRLRLPEATDAFCTACAHATGGNPFYVEELLRTIASEGVPPTDEGAALVDTLAPEAVARSILLRLSRLPPAALALARAIAVLGRASPASAARVAEVDTAEAIEMAGALAAAGVVADGGTLEFSHPIVRAVVASDASRAVLGPFEMRAAELLQAAGEPPERVAAHLLKAPPSGAAWVIQPLRIAASHALASGVPEAAVRQLRRALAEPPADRLATVLVELGEAESACAMPEAAERFEAALRLTAKPLERAQIRGRLGRALAARARFREAAEAYATGAEEARQAGNADLAAELDAEYLTVARLDADLYPAAAQRIEALVSRPPEHDRPGQRMLLADVALAHAWAGAPPEVVLPIAERAWADGALLAEQGPDSQSVYVLSGALLSVDALERELEVLDAALAEAQRRGAVMAAATARYCRSIPLYLQCRIPEALADAEHAREAEEDGWELLLPAARAYLALALLERGELDAVEQALELPDPARWEGQLPMAAHLDARARLRLAQRRPREALDDALAAGRLLEHVFGGTRARGMVDWRGTAALAALALGRADQAHELCDEDLALARDGERPREIGSALRVAARLEANGRSVGLLTEAVEALEASETVLELLRTRVDLGAALRRDGQRQAAREPLTRALDAASALGATVLADRARSELVAAGARPRRARLHGVESLTASELRVARLAAEGLTNREIAEALFVSRKTVDYHLRHVYQKLAVTRAGLAERLADAA